MEFPESVLRAVERAADNHPADIQKAIDAAEKAIRRLPEFETLVADLVRSAVQEMVYDARHSSNVTMRRLAGEYGGPAKTVSGDSAAVTRAAESLYCYRIAGTVLGSVLGEQLGDIAASELAKADGHAFNGRLCLRLKAMVPKEKQVRECVSEKRLMTVFKEVQDGNKSDAA